MSLNGKKKKSVKKKEKYTQKIEIGVFEHLGANLKAGLHPKAGKLLGKKTDRQTDSYICYCTTHFNCRGIIKSKHKVQ